MPYRGRHGRRPRPDRRGRRARLGDERRQGHLFQFEWKSPLHGNGECMMSSASFTMRGIRAAICCAALLMSCDAFAQQRQVKVMTFGSTWERVLKPLAPSFKQETGIE